VIAIGHVAAIDSGRPLRPSQTTMQTSSVPRFLISVSTCSQLFLGTCQAVCGRAHSGVGGMAVLPGLGVVGRAGMCLAAFTHLGALVALAVVHARVGGKGPASCWLRSPVEAAHI